MSTQSKINKHCWLLLGFWGFFFGFFSKTIYTSFPSSVLRLQRPNLSGMIKAVLLLLFPTLLEAMGWILLLKILTVSNF